MKTINLIIVAILFGALAANAQVAPGPVERKLTDSICGCLNKIDQSKINTKQEATDAFTTCFSKYPDLLLKAAEERKVEITDVDGMHALGIDIGKNLLRYKCSSFMVFATKMAQSEDTESHLSYGKLVRIDNKGLNYFVLTTASGKEESFVWLHQFSGSSSFVNGLGANAGKRVSVKWQDTEIYLPAAKGYFNVKEVAALTVLQ